MQLAINAFKHVTRKCYRNIPLVSDVSTDYVVYTFICTYNVEDIQKPTFAPN